VVAVSAAMLVPPAQSQPRTTAPDVYVNVYVTMTDTKFILSRHGGPRGADARFVLHNVGKHPHAFTLGTAKAGTGLQSGFSKTIMPGKQDILILFLDYRGKVPYFGGLPADRSKPGMRGDFTIGACLPGDNVDGC
jgi:hypothetical protein